MPAGVRQIIQKLLQKSPDKRFQTGNKLAEALGKELSTLNDQQVEQKKHKYIPLKIRWTLSVVAIVSLVSLISINIINKKQSTAMTNQAVDSGSSFAKFISTVTAEPLLSKEWFTIETYIEDAASRDSFSYLIVTDEKGIVRGASDNSLVGKLYEPSENAELISEVGDVHTTSSQTADGRKIFNIKTPIRYQSTVLGQMILGLSQDGLEKVKSTTGWLMFFLALITTSSVAVVMFIFGGLIARPLNVLNQSLKGFAAGNLDTRISLTRNDEIGEVFDGFNNMAAAIQDRYTEVTDELAQTGINKAGIGKEKQDDLATKAEQPSIKEETKEVTGSKLPSEVECNTNDVSDSKTDSQIGVDEEHSIIDQNKDEEKPEMSFSALVSDSDPELDLNPDQTIISTSQIGLDVEPKQVPEEGNVKKKESDVSKVDMPVEADLDLNPDETIISTSQINIDTSAPADIPLKTDNPLEVSEDNTADTSAKKPPLKRKPRKKPVKAKVETDITDKVSDENNGETHTKTGEGLKN
ncbi:MAG: HAMP domain-containing protein [Oleiphilaceae bacterium]